MSLYNILQTYTNLSQHYTHAQNLIKISQNYTHIKQTNLTKLYNTWHHFATLVYNYTKHTKL